MFLKPCLQGRYAFCLSLLVALQLSALPVSGQSCMVYGYVKDATTKESLIGVCVSNATYTQGTTTNEFGFFSLSIISCPEDSLLVHYVGYSPLKIPLSKQNPDIMEILLYPNSTLGEVVITAENAVHEINRMSTLQVPIPQLKKMPTLFGEADIMRAFQLMAGVQGGKEGTAGINVRGGSPDQNLYLLDDVPLYNVNHIGGFLSTFDGSAIKYAELYKGAFPARYSGRLSSVLDIRMKDGDMKERHGEYALGNLAMKFSLQGPIKTDTSSYFISIRRCNFDLLTRLAALVDSQGEVQAGYTFFDAYGKVNVILNPKQRLYFSFYAGRDRIFINSHSKANNPEEFSAKYKSNIAWGNQMSSIRLNHVYSPKTFGNTTFAFTHYGYTNNVAAKQAAFGSNDYSNQSEIAFTSAVTDVLLKQDFHHHLHEDHTLQFGMNLIWHNFNQGQISYTSTQMENTRATDTPKNTLPGLESILYVEDEFTLNEKTGFSLGLNFSTYHIQSNSFYSLQPRLLARRKLGSHSALKASFVTMRQFTHLLSNNGAGLPSDLWIPATKDLHPSNCIQAALGFATALTSSRQWEFSTEVYAKKFNQLVEYKEGISFFSSNPNITDKVTNGGVGRAHGVELQLQKMQGRTTGWCSYSLSRNERQFANLNDGNWFPFRYDRTHVATLVVNHDLNESISFSATWMYSTGTPVTLAQQQYGAFNYFNFQNTPQETESMYAPFPAGHIYNGRNSYRLVDFHKLDIAVNFTKKKPNGSRTWNISLYNAYNRQNPFFLFYRVDRNDDLIKLYQLSIFPIIPSFSYIRNF